MEPEKKMALRFALQHLREVVGVGSREEVLVVLCDDVEVMRHVPDTFEGVPVECLLVARQIR